MLQATARRLPCSPGRYKSQAIFNLFARQEQEDRKSLEKHVSGRSSHGKVPPRQDTFLPRQSMFQASVT
jgi:hypothetical protein